MVLAAQPGGLRNAARPPQTVKQPGESREGLAALPTFSTPSPPRFLAQSLALPRLCQRRCLGGGGGGAPRRLSMVLKRRGRGGAASERASERLMGLIAEGSCTNGGTSAQPPTSDGEVNAVPPPPPPVCLARPLFPIRTHGSKKKGADYDPRWLRPPPPRL